MNVQEILTPKVNCQYGAPMGRCGSSSYTDRKGKTWELTVNEHAAPFRLVEIKIDSQGYDKGGAYWGLSKETLYGYVGSLTDIRGYVWAKDREDAKRQIREDHPLAKFYR